MQHASGENKEDASCTKDQVEMAAGSSRDGCLIEQAEGEGGELICCTRDRGLTECD